MRRFYLSACGMVNALGAPAMDILQAILAGDTRGMVRSSGVLPDMEIMVAPVTAELPRLPESTPLIFRSRNNQLLLAAYQRIAAEVDTLIAELGAERIAVVLGSSTSGIAESETALQIFSDRGCYPADYDYRQQEMGSPAEFLATQLRLQNAAITISTACSSSGKAFVTARNLLESEVCDAVLVGGVDTLCRLTVNGFHALESVSRTLCRPFSRDRDGITIGEAAALFILSTRPAAIELVGVGESADAYHMSAPEPEGVGAETAMRQALRDAGIGSEAIAYLNLHGTATPKNDAMEAAVVQRVFGTAVPCSSTKGITGHTLGAAAATELGICWLLLSDWNHERRLAPHVWDGCRDTSLAQINLVGSEACYAASGSCYMMSNSFAFGGSNVSLILKREFQGENV